MPSFITTSAMMLGMGVGGLIGWDYSKKDERFGLGDRLRTTALAALYGTAGALAIEHIGPKRLSAGAIGTAETIGKALTWNPAKSTNWMVKGLSKMGFGKGFPKGTGGPMAALALLAIGAGGLVYSALPSPKTAAYASPDGFGGTTYRGGPTRERMDLIGATGDMVFGLNNSRHG